MTTRTPHLGFELEALEPRVLLSGDPIGASVAGVGPGDVPANEDSVSRHVILSDETQPADKIQDYDPAALIPGLFDGMNEVPAGDANAAHAPASQAADEAPEDLTEPSPRQAPLRAESASLSALDADPASPTDVIVEMLHAANPPPTGDPGQAPTAKNGGSVILADGNDTPATAQPLTLLESPSGSGLWLAFGSGAMDPADPSNVWSDPDYWSFGALAGDLVSIAIDTPASDVDPYVELHDAGDGNLASDDSDGPNGDAFISRYQILSSGTYYVKVGKNYYSTVSGAYELRVEVARGMDLEQEQNYSNDAPASANPLDLQVVGNHRQGRVAGTVMETEGANTDEDVFGWGALNAGVTIELGATIPSSGTLDAKVTLVDADGMAVTDTDGDPDDGHFLGSLPVSGFYFARVEANAGAGYQAQYVLDVDLTDSHSPEVVSVDGLPANGQTTDKTLTSFSVTFDEELAPATVNAVNPFTARYGGSTYVLITETQTWTDAEAYAQSVGGRLAQVGDAAEQAFLERWFAGFSPWIGLSDEAAEGTWLWSDGTPASYTNWGTNQPYSGYGDSDYVRMHSEGKWYVYRSGDVIASVIEFTSPADADGDGVPDGVDLYPSDPLNGLDLREAGTDGLFDTADDVVYTVQLVTAYSGGTAASVIIQDGPLSSGNYRMRIGSVLTDLVGNTLDGDGNGTGGDAYTQVFDVAFDAGPVFEGRLNNSWASAAELVPVEDPAGSGYFVAFGIGHQYADTAANNEWRDPDYWRFEGVAGDVISVAMDTPGSVLDPYFRIYGATYNDLTYDQDAGPEADALRSHYTLPANGTYYIVALQDYYQGAPDSYHLRLDLVRGGTQLESDAGYGNDGTGSANTLTLEASGSSRTATVAGTVMAPDTDHTDEDYFRWGTVNAGNVVELDVRLPSGSALVPWVRLVDASGAEVADEDGDPWDGHFEATIAADGEYYAKVSSLALYGGHRYVLTENALRPLDAEAWAQGLGGHLVTVNDADEQAWLEEVFYAGEVWIGLTDEAAEGVWVWMSGESVDYTDWASGQPGTAGHDFARIWQGDGDWYDGYSSWFRVGLAELPAAAAGEGGPGPWSQYLLDVAVSDASAPSVVSVDGLPVEGGTSTKPINTISVTFSEELLPSSVNATNPMTVHYGGHAYFLTPRQETWQDAEAYAQGLNAHLVTIDDPAEQAFLQKWFSSADAWIGLSDAAEEDTWTWASGAALSYTLWADGQPDNYGTQDYARMSPSGRWDDVGPSPARYGIVEMANFSDTDADGVPDAVDAYPGDALNAWDLREAGPDGVFDTVDDELYTLAPIAEYASGTSVPLRLLDGPLSDGFYRLTMNTTITDEIGNPIDGDGDGTGGDAFQATFHVDLGSALAFEGRSNDSVGSATALILAEDPVDSGYFVARGYGFVDPATANTHFSDPDFWSFSGQAGDVVSISMDTPDSDLDAYLDLLGPDSGVVRNDDNDGPNADAFISHYVLPETGTYYIDALKGYYASTPGTYEVRVDLARDIQLESDEGYRNDSIGTADVVALADTGGQNTGQIAGTVVGGEPGNVDEDYFNVGAIDVGETLLARLILPEQSLLQPIIEIRNAAGQVVSIAPNPTDVTVVRLDVTVADTYYVVVLASNGQGRYGQYILDATVAVTGDFQFADLSVTDVTPDATAESGGALHLEWTVGNFGTTATTVSTWWDRLVLSANATYGDGDDIFITSIQRNGALDPGHAYLGAADVTLPAGVVGDFWIFVKTDDANQVFEFTLEDNNVGVSAARVAITLTDYADLEASAVEATDLSVAGDEVTVQWRVTNRQNGTTGDGTPGGVVSVWVDRLVLSRNAAYGDGDDVLLTTVPREGELGAGLFYDASWTGILPGGLSGNYNVFVAADYGNAVYEYTDEHTNVAMSGVPIGVAAAPFADLVVGAPSAQSSAVAGQQIDVQWTVTNTTEAWATTTATWWYDRVVLSRDNIYGNGDDQSLGEFSHGGALGVGESYLGGGTVTIPSDIGGTLYLYVVADARNWVYEYRYEANNHTLDAAAHPIAITGPDLVIESISGEPAGAEFGAAVQLSWTTRNTGQQPAASGWSDRVWFSSDDVLSQDDIALALQAATLVPLPAGQPYQGSATFDLPLRPDLPPGTYYLIVEADALAQQPETDNANNTLASQAITLSLPDLPDLQVTEISGPAGGMTDGDTVTLTAKVQNLGSGPVDLPFTVRFEVNGVFLGRQVVDSVLLQNEFVMVQHDWVAQSGTPSVRVRADEYLDIYEGQEGNNDRLQALAEILAADLTPTDIAWTPETITDTDEVVLEVTVANHGAGDTLRDFWVRVEVAGVLAGRNQVAGGLAAGASDTVLVTWPAQPGTHPVRVVIDEYGQVSEDDEDNNERVEVLPAITDETPPVITSMTPADGSKINGTVQLSVTAQDNDAVQTYAFETSSDGVIFTPLSSGGSDQATWDVSALVDGDYYLKVITTDPSANASERVFTYAVDNTSPSAVLLSATPGEFRVDLDWSEAPETDFAYYRIHRSTTQGGGYQPINGAMTRPSFADRDVIVGMTYFYVLTVFDHVGNESAYSNEVSGSPEADATAPVIHAVSPAEGSRSSTTFSVGVDATDNVAVTSYVFEYSADGSAWLPIASGASSTATWDVSALDSGAYELRVTAYDAEGNSAQHVRGCLADHAGPPAPGNLSLTADQLAIVAAWDTVATADFHHYELSRSSDGGAFVVVAPNTTSTVYVDRQLSFGVTYTYRVVALDTLGNVSDPSAEVEATPLDDTTSPLMQDISPADEAYVRGDVDLHGRATDNIGVATFGFAYAPFGTQDWTSIGTDSDPSSGGSDTWAGQVVWSTGGLAEGRYLVRVTATDQGANAHELQYTFTVDRSPPASPAPPAVDNPRSGNRLDVSWSEVVDVALGGYRVYRDDGSGPGYQLIAETGALAVQNTGLDNGVEYLYAISAVDEAGNESALSPATSGTSTAEADLAITAIDFQPPNPTAGVVGDIVVTVTNAGPAHALTNVLFYDGDEAEGVLLGSATATVTASGSTEVRLAWMPVSSGPRTVTAVIFNPNVIDTNAANDRLDVAIAVNTAPVASAGDDAAVNWYEPILFDGTGSSDADGLINAYHWDFGDGQIADYSTTEHVYEFPGVYTVTLTVTDNRGATAEDSLTVTVHDTRADLVVSHLSWDPVEPEERDDVTVIATVSNIGNGDTLFGFFAAYYIDGQYKGYQRVNDLIPAGDSLDVTFHWTATKGLHTIEVVADDIQDNVNEIDEQNNAAESALTLQQIFFPDLVVVDLESEIVDTDVSSEQPLIATATVKNQGSADAFDFWVSLYRGDELVARRHVNELIVNAEQELTFEFDPVAGTHTLEAIADDPVSAVLESDEANNGRSLVLPELTLAYPDLLVEAVTILPREQVLSDGSSFDINATIANRGPVPVERRFSVSFYADGEYVGTRELTYLAADTSQNVAMQTRALPGDHTFLVVVDEINDVAELLEDNNEGGADVTDVEIVYPDLVITDIQWLPQQVKYGQTVGFTATVSNTTVVSTLDTFFFALYLDAQRIGYLELPRLTGHSSQPLLVTWQAVADPTVPHVLKGVVDVRGDIQEENEDNNEYILSEGTFGIDDHFKLDVATPGGTPDEFGKLSYTNDQVSQVVATVTTGSSTLPMSPAQGVTATLSIMDLDAGSEVYRDAMTFDAGTMSFTASLSLLAYHGNYSLRVEAGDGVDTVAELLTMLVIEELNFQMETDQDIYLRGEEVAISGLVTNLLGQPVAGEKVTLMVSKGWTVGGVVSSSTLFDNTTRTFTVETGPTGGFFYAFQPSWGDAGHFSVDAFVMADLVGTSGHAEFAILGLDLDPSRTHVTTTKNDTFTKTYTLENLGDDALTSLTLELVDDQPDDHVTASLSYTLPATLGPGARVPVTVTVSVPEDAPDSASFALRAVAGEGVSDLSTLRFTLVPAAPTPRLNPTHIDVGVNPGGFLARTVTLTNVGMGTMTSFSFIEPETLPWVGITLPQVDSLAPGESTTFDVLIAPSEGVQPGIYADRITVTDGAHSAQMVVTVEINSNHLGSVSFVLVNDAGQEVKGARITMVSHEEFTAHYGDGNTNTYHNIYNAVSNTAGIANVDDAAVGDYDYAITAPGHETLRGVVAVMPKSDAQVVQITLTAAPLSYTWTVEPIVIEDTYDITLNLTFAVDVPKPEFGVLPPWLTVPHEVQEPILDQVILLNPSLIEINDVTITVMGADGISVSSGGLLGTLSPQTSTVFAYSVEPGDYAYLNGGSTYLLVEGTYVSFDPVTFERAEDKDISTRIPLVNPSSHTVKVTWSGGAEEQEIKLPESGDGEQEFEKKFRSVTLPGEGTATEIVKLKIEQTATLEREGFDARLELTNGLDRDLVSLTVAPRVLDEAGVDVTDRFYIVPPELEGITGVDGSDNLGAYATMNGRWILIPGDGLGGTELEGKSYFVKAVMAYYVDGRLKEVHTNEVEITVHPQPQLYLHYYVPKNVLGDEPFRLGLLVENEGDGVATNLKIDSGQPEIVENESGLLIDFRIVSSSFGSVTGDQVRLVLGDVQPHSTAHGYWIMQSSLSGTFVEFTAELSHRAYKGIEINPLILDVTTEIIEHDFLFADPQDPNNSFSLVDRDRDGFPDYLINLWSGLRLPILIPENVTITQSPTPQDRTMELVVPETHGYVAVIVPDPLEDSNLRSVMKRGVDGGEDTFLSGNNFWKADGNLYFVDELGYIDGEGYDQPESATYILDFRSALALEELNIVPNEFNVIYSDGMKMETDFYTVNEPPPGTVLTTYELKAPQFYLELPPTEGQKAVIRAVVTNNGVVPESSTVDFLIRDPEGTETLLATLDIDELKVWRHLDLVADWTPTLPGEHTITVRIAGDAPEGEMAMTVWVNELPFSDAGADFFSEVSEPTTFDGTRSADNDGYIVQYFWDFGDDVWGNGMTPVHVYEHSGTYQVYVLVKDDVGAMTEDVMLVTINETRPDLLIEDIAVDPADPQEDEDVTVTGTVKNIGTSAVLADEPFFVALYVDGAYSGARELAVDLQPGASVNVEFTWHAETGNHMFTFAADDLEDRIDEADEGNNRRTRALYPDQIYFPDLTPAGVELSVNPDDPIEWGTPVVLRVEVRNQGTSDAERFRTNVYIDGEYIGYGVVDGLAFADGNSVAYAEIPWVPTRGPHTLLARVDYPLNHIVELDESNNTLEQALPEINVIYGDLVVKNLQMWPQDGQTEADEPLVAYATILNDSTIDVPVTIPVALAVDGNVVATAEIEPLAAGQEAPVRLMWMPESGTFDLSVIADPQDVVPESNEDNNAYTISAAEVEVVYPDLVIADIQLTGDLVYGAELTARVKVRNQGGGALKQAFNVRLAYDGQLLGVERVTQTVSGGSFAYVFMTWTAEAGPSGVASLTAIADANDEVTEADEFNNALTRDFTIDTGYVLGLTPDGDVYRTDQAVPVQLTVRDSGTGSDLGPPDGVSASLTVYDGADQPVFTDPFTYNAGATRFDVTLAAGTLPAGPYRLEALVTGSDRSLGTSTGLVLADDYAVTVQTDGATYAMGDGVVISGTALKTAGGAVAEEAVALLITLDGALRRVELNTEADGTFSYTFQTTLSEGGPGAVEARMAAGGLERSVSDTFSVEGTMLDPFEVDMAMSAGSPHQVDFTVTNVGTLAQTGLTVDVRPVLTDPAIVATVDDANLPASLAAGDAATFSVTFTVGVFVGPAEFAVALVSSAGGQSYERLANVALDVYPAAPAYDVDPGSLHVGVLPDDSVDRTVTLRNSGYADMTGMTVIGPTLPWVSLLGAFPQTLGPQESTAMVVRIAPTLTVTPGTYSDTIGITSNAGDYELPILIEVSSGTPIGATHFTVRDIYGFPAEGMIIEIRLQSTIYGDVVGEAVVEASRFVTDVSDLNGEATFEDLLAGSYLYQITAQHVNTVSSRFEIMPGVVTEVEPIVNVNPFQFTMTQTTSTEEQTLGEVGLGLVMEMPSGVPLITDRPGAEYLVLNSGATLGGELAYLDLTEGRAFKENTSFSINNLTPQDITGVSVSAFGDITSFLPRRNFRVGTIAGDSAVVLSFDLSVDPSLADEGDQVIEGFFHITWDGDPIGLTFPLRARVAMEPYVHDGREVSYVPYSGPWPTGPIMYSAEFIDTWFDQGNVAGSRVTGHDVGGVKLSQELAVEGETFEARLEMRNILTSGEVGLDRLSVLIKAPDGTDVTAFFDITGVALPVNSLAPGEAMAVNWQIRPLPGYDLGGATGEGVEYRVYGLVDFQINGSTGQSEMGPVTFKVMPLPEFAVRYEVQEPGALPNSVDIVVHATNIGHGVAEQLVIGFPVLEPPGTGVPLGAYKVDDPSPIVLLDILPNETREARWTIVFFGPKPDIAALTAQLNPSATRVETDAGFVFDAGVEYQFVSEHSIDELAPLYFDLVDAALRKVENEVNRLAFILQEIHTLLQEAKVVSRAGFMSQMYDIFGQMLNNIMGTALAITSIGGALNSTPVTELLTSDDFFGGLFNLFNGKTGTLGGLNSNLESAMKTAINAKSSELDLRLALGEIGTLIDRPDTEIAEVKEKLYKLLSYTKLSSFDVWAELAKVSGTLTRDAFVDILNAAIVDAEKVTGVENLQSEFRSLRGELVPLLASVKENAIFPVDVLYNELKDLIEVVNYTAPIQGIGRPEDARADLRPRWYGVGEPGNWLPVYQESWEFGAVYEHWRNINRLQVMQWENIAYHWELVADAYVTSAVMNAAGSFGLAMDPISGWAYGQFVGAMQNQIMGIYFDAMKTMRQAETMLFQGISKQTVKFMQTHQYESSGLWRMLSDFNNHVTYLIEHNPIDPEVSIDVESMNFSDILVPDEMPIGVDPVEIVVTNTSGLHLNVLPVLTVSVAGEQVTRLEGSEVSLAPGEMGGSSAILVLPRSRAYGNTGFDIEVGFEVHDPATLSRSFVGPYYGHVFVGTQDELASYQQQDITQPLGGAVGEETTFEKKVEIGGDLGAVRILMMHGPDADFDLHLYDPSGRHVGFIPSSGADEAGIPGSWYSGSGSRYQAITLTSPAAGTYRVVAEVLSALPEDRFAVMLQEIPAYGALLAASTDQMEVTIGDAEVTLHLDAQEWGGFEGVDNLQASIGVLESAGGAPLDLSGSQVTLDAGAMAPGHSVGLHLGLLINGTPADGAYSGLLTISGEDAGSGAALSVTVELLVNIDRTAPSIPTVAANPDPADTMPVTISGTSDVDTLVEIQVDDLTPLQAEVDAQGHYRFDALFLDLGAHTIKVRAQDHAGNFSGYSADLILTSSIDPFAPYTNVTLSGAEGENGWFASDVTVNLASHDENGSGVQQIEIAVGDGDWEAYAGSVVISTQGLTKVRFRATDVAGNVEVPETLYVKIDKTAPASAVDALPAESDPEFNVTWSGADEIDGSGLLSFTVYVSDNGGPYTAWLTDTTETSGVFTGTGGHTYAFYTRAADLAGNVEAAPSVPDADTSVAATEAPGVAGVVINGGAVQRSRVTTLAVQFTLDVGPSVSRGDLVLVNASTGQTIDPVDLAVVYDPGTFTATWSFPGLPGGSLPNGMYGLELAAASITSGAGTPMTEDYGFGLHVLRGDVSGDAVVNDLDLYAVWQNLLKAPQDRDPAADIDGDGAVDGDDVAALHLLFLARLPAPGAPAPSVLGDRIGQGTQQRSRIGSISMAFDAHVGTSLDASDLVVQDDLTGKSVLAADMAVSFDPEDHVATWTFPGLADGLLPEGRYSAVLPAGAVSDLLGRAVSTARAVTFHVLTGDVNGDAVTDALDLYRVWANQLLDPANRSLNEDVTGNGVVDQSDVLVVMANYRRSLPVPAGSSAASAPTTKPDVAPYAPAEPGPEIATYDEARPLDPLPGYYATAAFYESAPDRWPMLDWEHEDADPLMDLSAFEMSASL